MAELSSTEPETHEVDVLVVGGGLAGAAAAISAAAHGAAAGAAGGCRVLLAVKGKAGRSGATPMAGFDFADFMADARSVAEVLGRPEGDLRDSPAEFMADIVQEGEYLNNQRLVEAYVREAPGRLKELMDRGLPVTHVENAHGARYPRGVMSTGPGIGRTLRAQLGRCGAGLLEDTRPKGMGCTTTSSRPGSGSSVCMPAPR